MREILFRGQTRKRGQKVNMAGEKLPGIWVYGGVLQGVGCYSVIYGGKNENDPGDGLDKWVVYTDTLGQFTGKIDMNGKHIFEGDICQFHNDDRETTNSLVCWDETESQWQIRCVDHGGKDVLDSFYAERCEVIGNIHDNPELLEVQ